MVDPDFYSCLASSTFLATLPFSFCTQHCKLQLLWCILMQPNCGSGCNYNSGKGGQQCPLGFHCPPGEAVDALVLGRRTLQGTVTGLRQVRMHSLRNRKVTTEKHPRKSVYLSKSQVQGLALNLYLNCRGSEFCRVHDNQHYIDP